MNRHQRRSQKSTGPLGAKPGDRYVADCAMCATKPCAIHVIQRFGEQDLGICKGCPCSVERCQWCERTGEHWLGCAAVGLPAENPQDRLLQ